MKSGSGSGSGESSSASPPPPPPSPRRRNFVVAAVALTGSLLILSSPLLRWFVDVSAWDGVDDVPEHRRIKFYNFPSPEAQEKLRGILRRVEVTVRFDDGLGAVSFQADAPADFKHGHTRLPDIFYAGPAFFVSGSNPGTEVHNATYNARANKDLLAHLEAMSPRPVKIVPGTVAHGTDAWEQEGFALFFRTPAVPAAFSNPRTTMASHRLMVDQAQAALLVLARSFGQAALWKWRPHVFGKDMVPGKHATIIQEVVPTGGATVALKSSGIVWQTRVVHSDRDGPWQVHGETR